MRGTPAHPAARAARSSHTQRRGLSLRTSRRRDTPGDAYLILPGPETNNAPLSLTEPAGAQRERRRASPPRARPIDAWEPWVHAGFAPTTLRLQSASLLSHHRWHRHVAQEVRAEAEPFVGDQLAQDVFRILALARSTLLELVGHDNATDHEGGEEDCE